MGFHDAGFGVSVCTLQNVGRSRGRVLVPGGLVPVAACERPLTGARSSITLIVGMPLSNGIAYAKAPRRNRPGHVSGPPTYTRTRPSSSVRSKAIKYAKN